LDPGSNYAEYRVMEMGSTEFLWDYWKVGSLVFLLFGPMHFGDMTSDKRL
jgi:hypothetical protein